VTLSVGLALLPDHGDTAAEVLRAADEALLRSKQAGRNRVVVSLARALPALQSTYELAPELAEPVAP
jgi:predicted signal transduction protein with EAL and GGDEF domain